MDHRPVRSLVAVPLSLVLVATTVAPATSEDTSVSWEQVRAALTAGRGKGHQPPPAGNVSVTIPDLSWAIDDPSADPGVRRAACHQVTGLDDETAAPLAACLVYIDSERHHGEGHHPGHHPGNGHHSDDRPDRPSHRPHTR